MTDSTNRTSRRVTIEDSSFLDDDDDLPLPQHTILRENRRAFQQQQQQHGGHSRFSTKNSINNSDNNINMTGVTAKVVDDDEEGEVPILDGSLGTSGSSSNRSGRDGRCTFALVHDYKPTPTLPLSERQLQQHWLTGSYLNPAMETEFLRFNYRDLMGMAICIGFAIGNYSFVIFFASAATWIGICYLISATIQLFCGLGLAVLHFCYSSCSERISVAKMVLVTADAFVACYTLAILTEQFARECEEGGEAGGRERDDCTDRVNSALLVALCGVSVLLRIRALPAVILTMSTFLLAILSHFWWFNSAKHISTQKSMVRALVALGGAITAAVMCVCRDRMVRRQFNQSIRALIESRELELERKSTCNLLSSLLPRSVIQRIVESNERVEDTNIHGTIFFSDIAHFTKWSDARAPYQVVEMVSILCVKFDAAAEIHQVEKVKTIGDAYWAVCGLPVHELEHARSILEFAIHCLQIVDVSNSQYPDWDGIEIRIGVHTGFISGGVLGSQQLSYEIYGEANEVANVVEQNGIPMEVLCTEETKLACTLTDVLFVPHQEIIHENNKYMTYVVRVKAEVINNLKEERRQRKLAELREQEESRGGNVKEDARVASVSPIALGPDNLDRQGQAGEVAEAPTSKPLADSQRTGASDDSFRPESSAGTNDTATRVMPLLSSEDRALGKAFLVMNKKRQIRNSRISRTTGKSLDELRVVSQQFLRKRKKRIQEVEDDELQILEEERMIEAEVTDYLKEKHEYCLYTYASTAAEEEYRKFLLEHMRNLRLGSSVTMTSITILILLSTFIDSRENGGIAIIPSIVLAVAIIFGGISCCSAWGFLTHKADPIVMGICVLGALVSLKLIEQPNTVANDPLWLHIVTFVTYGHNLAWLPFPVLYASLFFFVALPSIALTVGTPYILSAMWNVLMLMVAIWPIAVIFERYFRKQFYDYKIFNGHKELKVDQHDQYLELLGQAVPEHIAPELRQWFATGMQIERPIMISYSMLVVAFLRFDPPEGLSSPLPRPDSKVRTPKSVASNDNNSRLVAAESSTTTTTGGGETDRAGRGQQPASDTSPRALYHTRDSVTTDMLRGSTSETHAAAIGTEEEVFTAPTFPSLRDEGVDFNPHGAEEGGGGTGLLVLNQQQQPQPEQQQSQLTWSFMCAIQEAIEAQLRQLRVKGVVKIKTVGNTTLLAGPIQPTRDQSLLQAAAAELVALALALRNVENLGYIRCGLHAGPAQGVVLGIERMAFDILGATVNKASRVMNAKGALSADILATREFAKLYSQWKETKQMGGSTLSHSDLGVPPPPTGGGIGGAVPGLNNGGSGGGTTVVSPFFPSALSGNSSRETSHSVEGTPMHINGTNRALPASSSGGSDVSSGGVGGPLATTSTTNSSIQGLSIPTTSARPAGAAAAGGGGPRTTGSGDVGASNAASSIRSSDSSDGPDIAVQQPSRSRFPPPPPPGVVAVTAPPNLLIPSFDGEESTSGGSLSRGGSSLSTAVPPAQLKAAEFTEAFQAEFKGIDRPVQLFRLMNVMESAQERRSRRGSSVVQPSLRSANSFVSTTQSLSRQNPGTQFK